MCEYCSKETARYQESAYHILTISCLGSKRILKVDTESFCPKYANCCRKNDPKPSSAFYINYCPNCGKKLQ